MDKITLSIIDTEAKYSVEYKESIYGNDSIVSYGVDNALPTLFSNCYKNSATLKSIIDGNVNYILGDDIAVNDCAASFRKQVNRNGMTMRQLVANIALSYNIFGGFAIQVIFSKAGIPVELFPLDFARCRTNESGTKIFYAKKGWTKYSNKSEAFDRYDVKKIDPAKPTQIFYFKGDFTPNIYPLPPYFGAITDVLTEIEASKYGLNSLSNGFSARYILNIPDNGGLTDTQKEGIEQAIKNKFCGTDTDSNFMLYWGDGGNNQLDIKKIETDDANEKFISIRDNARTNIFISERATPLLFGLPNATNGFSTNEYRDAYKLYQKSVISPIQDVIIEAINKILMIDDDNAITITPYTINFETNE